MSKPIDQQIIDLLAEAAPYRKCWVDKASVLIAEVKALRISSQRMHRRAQRAERMAHHEGRRADQMARQLRRAMLTPIKG